MSAQPRYFLSTAFMRVKSNNSYDCEVMTAHGDSKEWFWNKSVPLMRWSDDCAAQEAQVLEINQW